MPTTRRTLGTNALPKLGDVGLRGILAEGAEEVAELVGVDAAGAALVEEREGLLGRVLG